MGLRFRKSFKLAPGIRMNVGTGGTSWSLGPRGASIAFLHSLSQEQSVAYIDGPIERNEMDHPPGKKGRSGRLARLLIQIGIFFCAVGLLGPVLIGYMPAESFPVTGGSVTEGFFRLVPVEDSSEHLSIAITLVGFILLDAGAIQWRRGR